MVIKMRNSKFIGILITVIVYVIAFLGGAICYLLLPFDFILLKLLIADIGATVIVYLGSVIFDNASIYDPYWSVAPMVLVLAFMFLTNIINFYTILIVVLVEIWGLRLTVSCLRRFKNLNHQDWRYTYYKEKHPKVWQLINFFGIHLMPTLIVYIGLLPAFAYIDAFSRVEFLNITLLFAIIVIITAIVIECVADIQMDLFHKDLANQGKINRKGLWKNSRHPNYFGEILFWFGLFLMYLAVEGTLWILVFCPLVIFLLFVAFTIPLMEKRQLKNKPDYATYKKETNMLLPIWAPENNSKK